MQWDSYIFIDTAIYLLTHVLPFGLRSAPKLFNIMADLLAWILQEQGVRILHHTLSR